MIKTFQGIARSAQRAGVPPSSSRSQRNPRETKSTIHYEESGKSDKFCRSTPGTSEEQSLKLSHCPKQADKKDIYDGEFGDFLDRIESGNALNAALPRNDDSNQDAMFSIEWFNDQFARAMDQARHCAMQRLA